jgi:hypothetical protein
VSLLIAAAWLILACTAPGLRKALVPCALTAAVCLALIWYGDELGASVRRSRIQRPSPGRAVQLMGWLFLLAEAGASVWATLTGQ